MTYLLSSPRGSSVAPLPPDYDEREQLSSAPESWFLNKGYKSEESSADYPDIAVVSYDSVVFLVKFGEAYRYSSLELARTAYYEAIQIAVEDLVSDSFGGDC